MRLSRLSLKQHENEVERNCLMQSRAKEQFLRLIPPSARKRIQQKNLARIEQGLSEMGHHAMANYLLETQRIENPQAAVLPPSLQLFAEGNRPASLVKCKVNLMDNGERGISRM